MLGLSGKNKDAFNLNSSNPSVKYRIKLIPTNSSVLVILRLTYMLYWLATFKWNNIFSFGPMTYSCACDL